MEHEDDGDTSCNLNTRYSHKRIDKGTGRLGNKRASGDCSNDNIIKISQNTEKSPGDLRRLKETCYHPNTGGKPSANAGVKNSQKSKIMLILSKQL